MTTLPESRQSCVSINSCHLCLICAFLCRSFAGEALERERFQSHVSDSYEAGVGFAGAKVR